MREQKYFKHKTSFIERNCNIGTGTKIWHFSHVMENCSVGKNCNIGQNVVISPYVQIGDNVKIQNNVSVYTGVICENNVFIGPSCVFTNVLNPRSEICRKGEYRQTLLKEGCSLGANSTILCGITIGKYAFVGAGSVVTKNVPDYGLVYGNPARMHGYICSCGEKIDFSQGHAVCLVCKKKYIKKETGIEEE